MKKILCISLILCTVFLCGCGGTESNENDTIEETPAIEEVAPTTVKIPYSSDEFRGMNYEDARNELESLGFKHITFVEIKDLTTRDSYGTVESILVGENDTFEANAEIPLDSPISISYHVMLEVEAPITSDAAKGKLYKDVKRAFEDASFTTVRTAKIDDADNDNKGNGEVEYISVDGFSEYEISAIYPVDAEIIIYYSDKKYDVTFVFECVENLLFNKYDINVNVNGEGVIIAHGTTETMTLKLLKGEHEIVFSSSEEPEVTKVINIEVKDDSKYRYKLTCNSDEIAVTKYKKLTAPYTNKSLGELKVKKVENAFEKQGFKNVSINEINDLTAKQLDNAKVVTEIEIDGKNKFSKKDIFYSDSEVEITYHNGVKKEIPLGSWDIDEKTATSVKKKFEAAGFTNVVIKKYDGKYKKKARNNMIAEMTIDGDDYFSEGKEYPINSKIVIKRYSINYAKYSVATLMNELKNNSYAASEKFTDKYVEITGVVDSISSEGKGFYLYPKGEKWSLGGVECRLTDDKQKTKLGKLSSGDTIAVRGRITNVDDTFGYDLDLHRFK